MITVKEALEHILGSVAPLGFEKADILSARGRVIGEDVRAPRDIPPRDNSAMDGYAVRAEDTSGAGPESPVFLKVVEDIPAGHTPRKGVGPGEAARIMTGAPIPEGADAVVKVEETTCDDAGVRISAPAPRGDNIRYAGEDVTTGDLTIHTGTVLRPAEIGMLAALGRSSVKVYRRPLVAIIPTGDELVDIDEAAASPEKIVSSNSYSLAAQVMECGGIPLRLGIAKDSREDLTEKFRAALRADVIVSSAGVSVGVYDFVKDVMKDMGIEVQLWQVAQRPGKPMTFGSREGMPVFGLPGNPVSSMVTFEEYVRPTILKMTGHRNIFRRTVRATVAHDIEKKKGLRYFFRARVQSEGTGFVAEITGEQGSGILSSMVLANGIMVIPEGVEFVKAGDRVMVQLIDDSQNCTEEPEYLND